MRELLDEGASPFFGAATLYSARVSGMNATSAITAGASGEADTLIKTIVNQGPLTA